jgi:hypothetical protein
MKKQFLAGAVIMVLLPVLLTGIATGGTMSTDAQSGSTRMSISPDAEGKVVIWNSGQAGFLSSIYSGSFARTKTHGLLTIPACATAQFIGPIPVPVKINGETCQVKTVYFNWAGPNCCEITHAWVLSGEVPLTDLAVSYPGTGLNQVITIDLGNTYAIPNGLTVAFDIHDSGPENYVFCYGYGAKIKYPL